MALTSETFKRPDDLGDTTNPAVLYARSYLLTRTIVGAIGVALPVSLILAELFIEGSVRVRGSLSAYYHTSARDVFVGSLCVVGVLLITYMAGQTTRVTSGSASWQASRRSASSSSRRLAPT